ncbi:unnamed protein product, partial [Effrenium voratum]
EEQHVGLPAAARNSTDGVVQHILWRPWGHLLPHGEGRRGGQRPGPLENEEPPADVADHRDRGFSVWPGAVLHLRSHAALDRLPTHHRRHQVHSLSGWHGVALGDWLGGVKRAQPGHVESCDCKDAQIWGKLSR